MSLGVAGVAQMGVFFFTRLLELRPPIRPTSNVSLTTRFWQSVSDDCASVDGEGPIPYLPVAERLEVRGVAFELEVELVQPRDQLVERRAVLRLVSGRTGDSDRQRERERRTSSSLP